jgi:hypothetical protein
MAFGKRTPEQRAAMIAEIEAEFTRKAELANAPAIRLEPGQTVSGEIIQIASRTSEWGIYPVLTLKFVDGKLGTLHSFHQLMTDRLKELKPQNGDMLFVAYGGERQKNRPTEDEIARGRDKYHLYNLETDASLLAAKAAEAVDKPYEW